MRQARLVDLLDVGTVEEVVLLVAKDVVQVFEAAVEQELLAPPFGLAVGRLGRALHAVDFVRIAIRRDCTKKTYFSISLSYRHTFAI